MLSFADKVNASNSSVRANFRMLVCDVLGMRHVAKIGEPVVSAVAVDVIYFADRLDAVDHFPNDPMGWISKTDFYVSTLGADADDLPVQRRDATISMREISGFGIV